MKRLSKKRHNNLPSVLSLLFLFLFSPAAAADTTPDPFSLNGPNNIQLNTCHILKRHYRIRNRFPGTHLDHRRGVLDQRRELLVRGGECLQWGPGEGSPDFLCFLRYDKKCHPNHRRGKRCLQRDDFDRTLCFGLSHSVPLFLGRVSLDLRLHAYCGGHGVELLGHHALGQTIWRGI